jgi:hypothetical protein
MKLISFPVDPYVGQIFYEPETQKTYEFCEILKTNHQTNELIETASWIDITEKDLVP